MVDELIRRRDATLVLRIVNILAFIGTLFGSILFPRRPTVFFRGQPVDAQWTSSVLSRYTWTWARRLIDQATSKGDLEEKDIPQPDHTIRAKEVMEDWHGFGYKGKLIWELLYVYKARIALQWSVTIARCILGAAPFWTMLHLIDNLEQRGGGGSPGRELWGFVILLGVLSLVEQVWFLLSIHGSPCIKQSNSVLVDGWMGELLLHHYAFATYASATVCSRL